MVFDPADRRPIHRSPEIVLAEARRMAADILRRAERDAHDIRREAAEWASSARRDADAYRERVLADVQRARPRGVEQPIEPEPVQPEPIERVQPEPVQPETVQAVEPSPPPARSDVIDLRQRAEAREEQAAAARAATGSYVVGHAPPEVETSIDSKLHDVVRLAVRRTFHSRYP